LALKHLEKAKELHGADPKEVQEYEMRILHRLHTREIITREEFYARFPDGWKPDAT
jgi:hypothetical protein